MFPNDLGLFYTGSGNLKVRNPDLLGKSIGTWLGCFDFVGAAEAANGWCNRGSRRSHKCQSTFLKNLALPIPDQEI
jgi:hypothetical protein